MPIKAKGKVSAPVAEAPVQETENVVKEDAQIVDAAPVASTEGLGAKSATIEFVACLGDPSRDDVTVITGTDGKTEKRVDPTIVGYRLKATEDVQVPDCPPGDDFKNNMMSFTGDPANTRLVKAGEFIDLTKFEVGMLISRPEYNGQFTGGAIPVSAAYAVKGAKNSEGKLITTNTQTPTVTLRALKGSVKDTKMVNVLEFTKSVNPETKQTVKTRTIVPGFEKFEPLCKAAVRKSSASSGVKATATNTRNKGAEAFLRIAMSKKSN